VGVPEEDFEGIAGGFGEKKLEALRILNAAY
jgi:hypothetical protein